MKIYIHAKPGAKENRVQKIDDTHFGVWVTEPPIQGRANRAIYALLGEYFNVSVSRIRITSRSTSRQKIIEVVI